MIEARPCKRSKKPILLGDWGLWVIDVYVQEPKLDLVGKRYILEKLTEEIEKYHISHEFEYHKVGFALFHYGRRGTTISLWHWGSWADTFEAFNQRWYCYGHDYGSMESLGVEEPVFCHLDFQVTMEELTKFLKLTGLGSDVNSIIRNYLT